MYPVSPFFPSMARESGEYPSFVCAIAGNSLRPLSPSARLYLRSPFLEPDEEASSPSSVHPENSGWVLEAFTFSFFGDR